jgi:DNA polymerase-3 subunit alpha
VGHNVKVAGLVASVRSLYTRDGRPFASAVLEDLDGRVEVMVWPKVYAETKDLWQEGNMLLVEGKVRQGNDEVQLSCDSERGYQPEPAPEGVSATPEAAAPAAPQASYRLLINLTQSSDKDNDLERLRRVIDALKEFPGRDQVRLQVTHESRVTHLRLPDLTTGYCAQLGERLVELVGEEGVVVEPPPGA